MKCELPPTNAVMYMALCRSCPLNIHILKLNSLSVYTENPIFILLIKTIHYSEIKQETQGLFLQSTLFLYDTHKHSLFSFCPLSKPLRFPPTTPGPLTLEVTYVPRSVHFLLHKPSPASSTPLSQEYNLLTRESGGLGYIKFQLGST